MGKSFSAVCVWDLIYYLSASKVTAMPRITGKISSSKTDP